MKVEELMNKYYGNLNENDKLICKYILKNRTNCYNLSINEFATNCNVSTTTLFRFTQKISIPTFSELKVRLRIELENINNEKTNFLENVTNSYHKIIDDMKNRNCSNIFQKIFNAKRIIVYGSGYSQARVTSEFKRIFLPIDKIIFNMYGYDMAEAVGNLANEDDLVIIISLSGESSAVINLAKILKIKGVPILSITKMSNNTLASLCDENLYINSIELGDKYNIKYEISTPYFILIEILFLKYQKYLNTLN